MFDIGGITDLQTAKRIAKKLFQTYNNSSSEGTSLFIQAIYKPMECKDS